MNTHRILSVFLILAMVATLCVVAAAPAGAATATAVPQPTLTLVDPTSAAVTSVVAGTAGLVGVNDTDSGWNIKFITPTALDGTAPGVDSITVTFPATATVPTTWAAGDITIGGAPAGAGASTLGKIVVVPCIADIAPGAVVTLVFTGFTSTPSPATGAGSVKTPLAIGACTVSVRTTQDTLDAVSSAVSIRGINVTGWVSSTAMTIAKNGALTITGAGYTAGYSVDLKIAGVNIGTATVATDGTFTGTLYAALGGAITAIDGANVGAAYFTVASTAAPVTTNEGNNLKRTITLLPSITVTPSTALAGATVVVQGSNFPTVTSNIPTINFAGTNQVNVGTNAFSAINGETYSNVAAVPTAPAVVGGISDTGKFKFTMAVPASTTGTKQIVAIDALGNTATASFEATPQAVVLTPASSAVGTPVTVTGTGWKALDTVTITQQNNATPPVALAGVATVTTQVGADGTFTASIIVATGLANVNVAGTALGNKTAAFVIPVGTISVSPTSGVAGSTATITGQGFPSYSAVSNVWIGVAANVVTPTPAVYSDATGNFTATVVIPGITAGIKTVSVTCGGTTITGAFTIAASSVSVTAGLNSITGKYVKVWAFDGATQEWKLYDTAEGTTSTLSSVVAGQGYWIQATENCTLTYLGNNYTLYAGWNLVGWR